MIPYWLRKHVFIDDVKNIERAISLAELTTQAEIVPMIVKSSSNSFKEIYYFYFILLLVGLFTLNPLLIALIIPIYLLTQMKRKDLVFKRAIKEFQNLNIGKTKNSTGVLLFISLEEKRVVVLADEKIAEFVDQHTWDKVIQGIVSGIKKGNITSSLEQAISEVAIICQPYAPIVPNDINELSNHLVIKE